MNVRLAMGIVVAFGAVLAGCQSTATSKPAAAVAATAPSEYVIGPGDTLQVFVWQHPEVSVTIPVRPDGRISTPLVEDVIAVGKTPTQLARDLEAQIGQFIRTPSVSVIVTNFVGTFSNQVRVVGQAAAPQAIPFRQDMTLLDVMIQVGGLSPTAAGNRAKIIRKSGGKEEEIRVRIEDLLNDGDTSKNITMSPGDVLIIPESRL
ncbi:MAG: polysaccharide export protein [Gammaproteobacteria bacterium]|nr:polysaccharide export protein [Gammaproteobacteria bacterium]